ncbi:MAG: cysteine dioxygenase [Burkholderiaceae bacterium]
MNAEQRHQLRQQAVNECVARVRAIESDHGVTRDSLKQIKQELIDLAAKKELFPLADFPPPDSRDERNNALYRLSEDDDHRFALYAQLSVGGTDTPAHNHTTWAVIVGIQGDEMNRLYQRDAGGGVEKVDEYRVCDGTGIAFLPDDLHSIHISGDQPVLNFHMYGLGLEQLDKREFYNPKNHEWKHFPANSGIRDLPAPTA